LASLLQTMQAERATGTLSLENGADNCSLYFLFGHLFHASGPGGQGEEVVVNALGWRDGSYQFDPRAKLPAEETIKASPAELIAQAEGRQAPAAAPAAAAAGAGWTARSADAPSFEAVDGGPAPPYEPAREEVAAVMPPAAAPAVERYAPPSESGLASWTAAHGETVAPPTEAYPGLPVEPESPPIPVAITPAPAPNAPAAPMGGAPGEPPVLIYPLPTGRPHYEGLKSAFVDFPRLLRTLRSDRHTGYISLSGSGYSGVLLLHEGQVLEAVCSNGTAVQGENAFLQIRRHMDGGDGVLDVIELDGGMVIAMAQMYTAPHLYTGLLGRFVNLDALLEYLAEEKVDGSVVVSTPGEMGVILLREGTIAGAYSGSRRAMEKTTASVAALAGDRRARIEVVGGAGQVIPIDVDAALARPY
jgi:hypothetical protein